MNILKKANEIINERSEEKEREYGDMSKGISKAASIASLITSKDITERDVYIILFSLKMSRESFKHKEDNLLDAVAYIGALNNYENLNKNEETK